MKRGHAESTVGRLLAQFGSEPYEHSVAGSGCVRECLACGRRDVCRLFCLIRFLCCVGEKSEVRFYASYVPVRFVLGMFVSVLSILVNPRCILISSVFMTIAGKGYIRNSFAKLMSQLFSRD